MHPTALLDLPSMQGWSIIKNTSWHAAIGVKRENPVIDVSLHDLARRG
jgi:hypothetical protein